jgi:hypothetical protein
MNPDIALPHDTSRSLSTESNARPHKILVVEDDAAMQRLYQTVMSTWPLPLDAAFMSNGIDALFKVERMHPDLLNHIGVESEPPHISPARGPTLSEDCGDALIDHGVDIEPDWDLAAQPTREYCSDQRISWVAVWGGVTQGKSSASPPLGLINT